MSAEVTVLEKRQCRGCGKDFPPRRKDQFHCHARCRWLKYAIQQAIALKMIDPATVRGVS